MQSFAGEKIKGKFNYSLVEINYTTHSILTLVEILKLLGRSSQLHIIRL